MLKLSLDPKKIRSAAPVWICALLILVLILLPTGFEDAQKYRGTEHCAALVLETDNRRIIDTGLVRSGEQSCTLRLLGSTFRGQETTGINHLSGSLEQDKVFAPGDRAMVRLNTNGDAIISVSMVDHYRLSKEVILAACFVLFLVLFAGKTGIRAVLSFALTILALWKLLVPIYLKGGNPVGIGLLVATGLTVLIIALVYGFDRRCLSAVTGAVAGLLVTCALGVLFTDLFQIHGAIMPYSESLLYSGYNHLNLTKIFMAGIFIGSSGAVMDLAVDITSAVHEVVQKKPGIDWREAVGSGMNVGRAAMGTMTTTLLLAYSGGYLSLLMVFMAQGTPMENILNYKYVSAELVDTVVGSFGLVSVAPLTALASGWLLTRKSERKSRPAHLWQGDPFNRSQNRKSILLSESKPER